MDGVAVSNGQYVLFLDGDDYFSDDVLTILYNEIQKNPEYDFYEFGYIKKPSNGKVFPSFTGKDRFPAYFTGDKYPANTMWNKVYEINLLKKAFLSMERAYLNHTEDLYESIVIAYYSKKVFIMNVIVINYSENTGISNIFDNYNFTIACILSTKYSLNLIQVFLNKIGCNINLTDLSNRLLNYVLKNHKNMQDDSEFMKNLFRKLFEIFDKETILDYWYYREKKNNESLYIAGSLDYRLGRKILSPLRKIKKNY